MEKSEVYCSNPLLMLQTVRVFAESGEIIPENVRAGILSHASLIKKAPKAEIRSELESMLMSRYAEIEIKSLFDCGILKVILPQLDRCFYEPQKNKYHIYNVGEHILQTVAVSPYIIPVRWAALLHDIGKPLCASRDSAGVIHFYGHHAESVRIAKDICYKYSFDEALRREICLLIEYHDVHFEQSDKGVKRALARMGEASFMRLLQLQEADAKAKAPEYTKEKCAAIEQLREICAKVVKSGEPYRYSDLAIGKRDLIKMKYRAEHQMRDVLRTLFDEVIEDPSLNNREYLLQKAKKMKNFH